MELGHTIASWIRNKFDFHALLALQYSRASYTSGKKTKLYTNLFPYSVLTRWVNTVLLYVCNTVAYVTMEDNAHHVHGL